MSYLIPIIYTYRSARLRSWIDGPHPGTVTASNLEDFRERLEEAACCGHGVAFCVREDNTIVMLHVIPCKCTCGKQHD